VDRFVAFPDIERVTARGSTRAAALLRSGLAVDFRAVRPEAFGAALLYFTGSKEHSIELRRRALEAKLKLNEYGAWRGRRRIAGHCEEDVYAALGLCWIPPELRENRGEIEAAAAGTLPRLIEAGDLRGDLHVHTSRTDGRSSLEEMAHGAADLGLEYLAVTDHTRALAMTHGFDARRARASLRQIRSLAERLEKPALLAGVEVEILADGRLDLPDAVLAELDFVVAAVHSQLRMSRADMTRRVVRALRNRWVHALAHPTGRLLGQREPVDLDLEQVASAAAAEGVWLELNGQPDRMDLGDIAARAARERGVRFIVSSDAHSVAELRHARLGLSIARRAWLGKEDVINALPLRELHKQLRARRH
jgi:DNA polymerase (family 10)